MSETISKRLKREREERILKYIKESMTSYEIADREGIEPDYARKTRNTLAGRTIRDAKRQPTPFGLTDATKQLRLALGNKLFNLAQDHKMHDLEIARDVGIPVRHQKVANDASKPKYNWKLSQIERMAKVYKTDPNKLIIQAMKEELKLQAQARKVKVIDMIEEWLNGTA